MSKVILETVRSVSGTGWYIDGYRFGGSEPFGGRRGTQIVTLEAKEIIVALLQSQAGREALAEYMSTRNNARLVAAAPELLDACEAFISAKNNNDSVAAYNKAHAAIAKATGAAVSAAVKPGQ